MVIFCVIDRSRDCSFIILLINSSREHLFVETIENARKDSAYSSSASIHRQVMSEYILGVCRVEPCLKHGVTDGESRIETGSSKVINGAEGPEDDANRRDAPYTEIWSHRVSASHMQNEKDEDKCADDLHV